MRLAAYLDVQEDDQSIARGRERAAFDESIRLMEHASDHDQDPTARAAALHFTTKLWTVLIDDLADVRNGLPRELRAQIISIGIWLLREAERLRGDASATFDDMLAVSRAIRDGLK